MSSIVHTMSDRMPGTASGPPLDAFTASRRAYSGLVPMSPRRDAERSERERPEMSCRYARSRQRRGPQRRIVPWGRRVFPIGATLQRRMGAAYTPALGLAKARQETIRTRCRGCWSSPGTVEGRYALRTNEPRSLKTDASAFRHGTAALHDWRATRLRFVCLPDADPFDIVAILVSRRSIRQAPALRRMPRITRDDRRACLSTMLWHVATSELRVGGGGVGDPVGLG